LKVVSGPTEWHHQLRCIGCGAVLEVESADVHIGRFGANYGGDTPEERFYVECIVCGTECVLQSVPPRIAQEALERAKST